MILGIGVDLVDIARIKALMGKYGERFITRVFSPEEIEYCTRRHDAAACLAGRFAAKEAAFKALSADRFSGIGFKEIRIIVREGRPELTLEGKAKEKAQHLGITGIYLSISHDKGCAVAMVVLDGAG
jgi:holo-[acyl-carrier protein] synthase